MLKPHRKVGPQSNMSRHTRLHPNSHIDANLSTTSISYCLKKKKKIYQSLTWTEEFCTNTKSDGKQQQSTRE